jgi:alkylation response protein AidB-like acyl-CoA dehydrogenase
MAPDVGTDAELWAGLGETLGCHGLGIPEEYGGSGGTLVEQGVLFEQLGAALAVIPSLGTWGAAVPLLRGLPAATSAPLLSEIASGRVRAAVVWDASVGFEGEGTSVTLVAGSDEDSWTARGSAPYVVDGHVADVLLLVAPIGGKADDELAVAALHRDAAGVACRPLRTADQTRGQASLDLDDAPVQVLARDARTVVRLALAQTTALLAVEQVGSAQRVLDGTTAYAKVREQFGAPIGALQAVRHRLVDMLQDLEAARSVALYALVAASRSEDDVQAAASAAASFCSDAGIRVAEAAIQLHGAIGLTWEHWAQLYFKRAWSSAILLGGASGHRERLAGLIAR